MKPVGPIQYYAGEIRTYKLPGVFWHDHTQRDLPEAECHSVLLSPLNSKSPTVKVEMDPVAVHELLSDAEHYTDEAMEWDADVASISASARRTIASIKRQAPEIYEDFQAKMREQRARWMRG